MTERVAKSKSTTRRKFLAGAALTGAAAVAMPQVSRAQTVTWKYQSTWPTKDIFHEFAVDYAKKVNDMSGGRLKLDVLAAGAVVPAFQLQDAVHSGVLDAGHGVTVYWYGKNKAASLFGTPPSFGWDAHSMLAWFYYGGGEALYNELINDILKLNAQVSAPLSDWWNTTVIVRRHSLQYAAREPGHPPILQLKSCFLGAGNLVNISSNYII